MTETDSIKKFAVELLDLEFDELLRRSGPITQDALQRVGTALCDATENPDSNAHDTLMLVAASSLREGSPLPGKIAHYAADVLQGKRSRPSKRGRSSDDTYLRDYRLNTCAREVSAQFGLQLYTNNELATRDTAATITSEASAHAKHVRTVSTDVVINAIRRFS